MAGNEIVETIVKEVDFVVTNKIVEERVEESEEVEQVLDHENVVVVKKDDTYLIKNSLSKSLEEGVTHQVPSSKQLRGREFIMLGFLFLWCTFSWEAMLLEQVVHQPTSPNLVLGKVQKWKK
ncbi:unnamed protein product [Lactuca saligna]|uniref:Uncharacterized protein n=1 Tax=Lactuca saligna TaxID=75948 RepID=A0AA35ULI1_LACSI|nr:unnamed protein product [Lactuca saligna]CAI9266292.1 unnamed protein product [Lactuca saligna]